VRTWQNEGEFNSLLNRFRHSQGIRRSGEQSCVEVD